MSNYTRTPYPPLEDHYIQGQQEALEWFNSCIPRLDDFKNQRLSDLESIYEFSDHKSIRLGRYENGFSDQVQKILASLEGADNAET